MSVINRHSEAYNRITTAGFTLDNASVECISSNAIIRGLFTCYCNKKEFIQCDVSMSYFKEGGNYFCYSRYVNEKNEVDLALLIEDAGAVSIRHLKDDGFTDEEIKYIRRAYDEPQCKVAA